MLAPFVNLGKGAFKLLAGLDSTPAVSVLLAVRNGMPHLEEAVRSILDQTFTDFELLVVDNGSSDGSPELLHALSDERVRYLSYSPPGLAGSLNYGLGFARAALIARMDADDLALPGRLQAQFDYMEAHSECILLGSAFDMIDDDGRVTGSAVNVVHDEVIRWAMLFFNPFLHSGIMFRREVVACCGGYDEEFEVAQDFDLWRRLSSEGRMHNLKEALSRKRFTRESTTGQSSRAQLTYAARTVGEYAAAYAPSIKIEQLVALRNWYIDDCCPSLSMARRLPRCFDESAALLEAIDAPGALSEARALERSLRAMMRYRSHRAAARMWSKPWQAARLLSIGQAFDPDGGSLARRTWQWARRKASCAKLTWKLRWKTRGLVVKKNHVTAQVGTKRHKKDRMM